MQLFEREDPSVVVERPPLKSFMTESSFAPVDVNSSELLQQKISSIITSFVDRLLLESRIPCLLTITYRHSYEKPVSKSFKFPKLNILRCLLPAQTLQARYKKRIGEG